jgi:hypothetical protein
VILTSRNDHLVCEIGIIQGLNDKESIMDAQYYARFNELIDKLAADEMTESEKKEYQFKCREIMAEELVAIPNEPKLAG